MGDDKALIAMGSRDRDRELLIPVMDGPSDDADSKASSPPRCLAVTIFINIPAERCLCFDSVLCYAFSQERVGAGPGGWSGLVWWLKQSGPAQLRLGFVTSMTFIFLVGVFMSSWLGASLLGLGEWFIKRMPFVRHIYNASKQISSAISPDQNSQAFKEVVIIRHPRVGEYAMIYYFCCYSSEIVVSGGMSMPQVLATMDSRTTPADRIRVGLCAPRRGTTRRRLSRLPHLVGSQIRLGFRSISIEDEHWEAERERFGGRSEETNCFTLICVFGLSFLMSLTSTSVWINLPTAAILIIFCRYMSLDLDIRKKSATGNKLPGINSSTKKRSIELYRFPLEKSNWRNKVNSLVVEEAIDHFTRHLISEWVTDLWYSRITPDRDGPEELVQTINDVFGEFSSRARDINLIDLLTRDIINLFCNHLELSRSSISKIGRQEFKKPPEHQDFQLKQILAAGNKLHPALFSTEAEHKVLQHLVNGLMLVAFNPKDLQCSFFRFASRELLACAVFRPIINLANPRFLNEKIESLVISFANKSEKGAQNSADHAVTVQANVSATAQIEQLSSLVDPSAVGVELMQFRHGLYNIPSNELMAPKEGILNHQISSSANFAGTGDTILMPDARTNGDQSLYSDSFPSDTRTTCANLTGTSFSKGEWGQILDIISQRKRQALEPEHLENVWTKGRNYRKKEGSKQSAKQNADVRSTSSSNTNQPLATSSNLKNNKMTDFDDSMKVSSSSFHEGAYLADNVSFHVDFNGSAFHQIRPLQERTDIHHEDNETASQSSYETEDDESINVTGLDSPVTRVWDSKNKRNSAVSRIRHPLETSDVHSTKKKANHIRHPRTLRTPSGRRKPRSTNHKPPLWLEVERTSFLLGEEQDILNEATKNATVDVPSDAPDVDSDGRIHCGGTASSSMSSVSASELFMSSLKSPKISLLADSFLKLRCEVLGANVVKSGLGTFAVYSISVTDANKHCWSIKRRFRHFEELHRRLKEFPEYNLSLPPKHFLSSGLDVPVVQERCKLLDRYLKKYSSIYMKRFKAFELPTISGSIEVWDFLSVDSQTYMFSDSLSVIQTLSGNVTKCYFIFFPSLLEILAVDLDDKPYEKSGKAQFLAEVSNNQLSSQKDHLGTVIGENTSSAYLNGKCSESDALGLRKRKNEEQSIPNAHKDVGVSKSVCAYTDLVDVLFQLKDGGWIRRQAFWVAKQLLQLGMGDAFDDWLIDKIQLLTEGSVVANIIRRIEQILWPDGIFLTKHPKRKPAGPVSSPGNIESRNNFLASEQQVALRAKFVYELIIDKAPAALVGLVGRKEYEQCAQDVYFFLQSAVCLKQLAVELLELLLLATFPELDDVIRQCHENKDQFGAFEE
ncbi:hypothetical protein HPP92_022996 [Vanilla planifolia]|uniref:Uncharacterized protein n=1 Tax=Vanilla planifolia TaxID=51239 RepID=A0A835UCF3_VANPL|nr:hypothetical protein HPP92_022996 [Vanilla planifolia]